jgi:hypothetical protein
MATMVERYFELAARVPAVERVDEPLLSFASGMMSGGGVVRRPPTYTIVRCYMRI